MSTSTDTRTGRLRVLAICCLSLFIVGIDVTIVNVALPSIRTDLDASVSELQWTIDAYTLVLASLLILSGSMGDRLGRVRVFQAGLVIFTLASLACALAPTPELLIAFRVLQAIGGSMLNPVALSIIRNAFDDPRERAQAIGVWGAVVGLSMALGPVVGGALTEVSWRLVFLVNIPVGLAAIALTALYVPTSRADRVRRIDALGQLLVVTLLSTLVFGIIEGVPACYAVAAAAFVALLVHEPRRVDPLIELRFFRSAPFSGATVIAVCAFAAMGGFLLMNTLYLQDVRGFSPFDAGLLTLPMAATTAALSPISGRIVGSRGTRLPLVVGGLGIGGSALMLTGLSPTTSLGWILAAYVVFGLGFGAINAPITNTAVSGMPASQAGVAAAVASTSRQVGQTLGVAIIGLTLHDALPGTVATGWWIVAGCGLAIVPIGWATSSRWAVGTAERTGQRLAEEVAA